MSMVTYHYPSFGLKHQLVSGHAQQNPSPAWQRKWLAGNCCVPPIRPNKWGPILSAIKNHTIERKTFVLSSIENSSLWLIIQHPKWFDILQHDTPHFTWSGYNWLCYIKRRICHFASNSNLSLFFTNSEWSNFSQFFCNWISHNDRISHKSIVKS